MLTIVLAGDPCLAKDYAYVLTPLRPEERTYGISQCWPGFKYKLCHVIIVIRRSRSSSATTHGLRNFLSLGLQSIAMKKMLIVNLPVDLIAEIFGELNLDSLIKASYASKQFHTVASDASLNPWRKPILRNLRSATYESALKHLSVRSIVPRQNWIDILSVARPSFILYEATLPNLKSTEWEECYKRRFLPGWRKWRKDGPWKEAYLKSVPIFHHRRVSRFVLIFKEGYCTGSGTVV